MRLLRGPPPKKKLMCIMLNSSVLSIDLYSDRNLMLKECAKRKYAYVYPLSGHGFPIKSWDYIHRFYNEHSGGAVPLLIGHGAGQSCCKELY